ncbi:MAG TPA: hypothetical protein VFS44_09705 [Gemmatimonadaceae bacterium]|nr:hypothetical protein [Gemmatimonadaceae bacterium]
MRHVHRIVPLALAIAAMLAVAAIRPRPADPLHIAVLVLAAFAGAFALSRALLGVAARRMGWLEGAGGILLAAGLFLVGASVLPFAGARGTTFTSVGAVLFVAGLALQARAFATR